MAVNTAALKTFAPAMRRQLMEAVGRKLDLLLNSQTPDTLSTYAKQIAELRDEQEKSREQLLEHEVGERHRPLGRRDHVARVDLLDHLRATFPAPVRVGHRCSFPRLRQDCRSRHRVSRSGRG